MDRGYGSGLYIFTRCHPVYIYIYIPSQVYMHRMNKAQQSHIIYQLLNFAEDGPKQIETSPYRLLLNGRFTNQKAQNHIQQI